MSMARQPPLRPVRPLRPYMPNSLPPNHRLHHASSIPLSPGRSPPVTKPCLRRPCTRKMAQLSAPCGKRIPPAMPPHQKRSWLCATCWRSGRAKMPTGWTACFEAPRSIARSGISQPEPGKPTGKAPSGSPLPVAPKCIARRWSEARSSSSGGKAWCQAMSRSPVT